MTTVMVTMTVIIHKAHPFECIKVLGSFNPCGKGRFGHSLGATRRHHTAEGRQHGNGCDKDQESRCWENGRAWRRRCRPSASKNADGTLKPLYLRRTFKYLPSDRFELEVVNSADPFGAAPLARIKIRGHMLWRGAHPIAAGAQKVDFVADEDYQVAPLAQGFADLLNKVASAGYAAWTVNASQSIFGKTFPPFGLKEGENFMEYDLVYLRGDLLFWGARNIDGRGFDTEQNRPTNLQIPLVRK